MITLATVACATPPQAQVDAANAALTKATAAGATEYAPEAYRAAQDAQAKLDAELKTQADKFAFMRAYEGSHKPRGSGDRSRGEGRQ